jgi:hypothetical protein
VLSEVLFQNEACSFKVTTETQTWVTVLRSPGRIEALREDRDYRLFNLGERVMQRLGDEGWRFIDALLARRLQATDSLAGLQSLRPAEILGRRSLEDIASTIAASRPSAAERQMAYSGIDALAAICVGDIGDIITLFDRMIEHIIDNAVPPRDQTAAYRRLCGQRLWELASKDVGLKDQALGFADAAHELLRSSHSKVSAGRSRLRQYTKVYVRDIDQEAFEKIRRLIDAGVFTIEGGVGRTKTKDADPITHFVLAFRKMLGVNSWIGLSDRDRFELTGEAMHEWLNEPSSSKEVLIRNQDTKHVVEEASEQCEVAAASSAEQTSKLGGAKRQQMRFEEAAPLQQTIFGVAAANAVGEQLPHAALPTLLVESVDRLPGAFAAVCTAFGFEERALISAERVAESTRGERILAVRYQTALENPRIADAFSAWNAPVVDLRDIPDLRISQYPGDVLVDITGMRTTFLWSAVHATLRDRGQVWIAYTRAERYWPSDAEVLNVLGDGDDEFPPDSRQLNKLRSLVSGEKGGYEPVPLLGTRDDIMRPLCLIAVASPKMHRLERLIESRSFDRVEIIAAHGDTPRARLSRIAGKAASVDVAAGPLNLAASTDLAGNVRVLERLYQATFVEAGMDIALGLTGSKIQSVAMAGISAAVKVAEAWYAQPSSYEPKHYTKGAETTQYYRLSLA